MAKKVLIVEDDSNIAELLNLYLAKEGFEPLVAKDGGKGVEQFRAFQPDLVLLDIMLPVMDGWSVLKKIRESSKVPVIMLTAKGETSDKVSGLEMGADDYIVKPFEMKELIARINAVLRRTEIPEDTKKKLVFDKLEINLDSYELTVDGKKISVVEALQKNSFDRIYIMFGINELGWPVDSFVRSYGNFVQKVKELQPNAKIYVENIFPVTANKSNQSDIYNNTNIRTFNEKIKAMAQEKGAIYVDLYSMLSDENGNLPKEYSPDGVHLEREYCDKWVRSLMENGD